MFVPLFPSIAHVCGVEGFDSIKSKLVEFTEGEKEKKSGIVVSNRGGWHSEINYNDEPNLLYLTLIKSLKDYFSEPVNGFKKGTEFKLTSLWININLNGDYNLPHIHPNCDMSGVFWISTPENSGQLVFESPNAFGQNAQMSKYSDEIKSRTNTYPAFDVDPHEGTIMFFPASIYHSVSVNKCKDSRISAGFNLKFM
tara:strand:+ start:1080 stop:1670 length:591 start_codon:yes stop_codon:yes gene_type:complete